MLMIYTRHVRLYFVLFAMLRLAARMRNSVQIENNVALGENRPPAET